MNICFVDYYYPPFPGGSEVQAWELTKKMRDMGVEIHVVTRSCKGLPDAHEMDGVKVHRAFAFGPPQLAKALFTLTSIPKTASVVKRTGTNVIISQEIFAAPAGHFAKKRCGKPFIYIHELTSKDIKTVLNPVKMLLQRLLLPRLDCDVIVSMSKFIKDEYFDRWGVKQKVVILGGGVDVGKFNPSVDGKGVREEFGIGKDDTLLITAKQLYGISAKGLEDAVKALPSVVGRHPNVKYLIIGEGDGKDTLENLVKSLGLEKNVIFAGAMPHDDIPRYLAASDIIVQTFAIEVTVGMSLLESLAMGKPVVVTMSGEIGNILNDSTAMLVRSGDIGSIADGINRLIDDQHLRDRLGLSAYELVKKKYGIDVMAKNVLDIAENLKAKYC